MKKNISIIAFSVLILSNFTMLKTFGPDWMPPGKVKSLFAQYQQCKSRGGKPVLKRTNLSKDNYEYKYDCHYPKIKSQNLDEVSKEHKEKNSIKEYYLREHMEDSIINWQCSKN